MSDHPAVNEVLRYLKGDLPPCERDRFLDHLRECDGCRTRVEAESEFDQLLRHRLSFRRAPAGLLEQVRDGLDETDRAEPRGLSRRRIWTTCGGATAAAVLALLVVLGPDHPGAAFPAALVSPGPAPAVVQPMEGVLVCLGCARMGVPVENHRNCAGGDHRHATGLQTADGRLWSFAPTPEAADLLDDRSRRGQRVELSARPYRDIDTLRVYAAAWL